MCKLNGFFIQGKFFIFSLKFNITRKDMLRDIERDDLSENFKKLYKNKFIFV